MELMLAHQSWSCVPNHYAVPLLAPAYDEDICPHWAERWEIRTRPLGCQVSTITSLTSIISIVSTLVFVLLVFLLVLLVRRMYRLHAKHPGWWKVWRIDWHRLSPARWLRRERKPTQSPEQAPLLAA